MRANRLLNCAAAVIAAAAMPFGALLLSGAKPATADPVPTQASTPPASVAGATTPALAKTDANLPKFVPGHQALSMSGDADGDASASSGSDSKPLGKQVEPTPGSQTPKADVTPVEIYPETKKIIAAKNLFGQARTPAPLAARSIGFYSKGCLAGGIQLPIDGPAWQAMRLSRNRNWGHPKLISLVEHLADDAQKLDGWPGLLVGDISQARGGPMLTGHASHQIGLDADIWLTPMPKKRFSEKERENVPATSMLDSTDIAVDPKVFTDKHVALIKRAASYPEVERVLVHPAIKKALCEAAGTDRAWLGKVRPIGGHYYHFHVRIKCPPGMAGCISQPPPTGNDGCGKEVEQWLARLKPATGPPKPRPPGYKPPPPKAPLMLAEMPKECQDVLRAGPDPIKIPKEALLPPPVPPKPKKELAKHDNKAVPVPPSATVAAPSNPAGGKTDETVTAKQIKITIEPDKK